MFKLIKWRWTVLRCNTDTWFIVCSSNKGDIRCFWAHADGRSYELNPHAPCPDVRQFYRCSRLSVPPICRADIQAYLSLREQCPGGNWVSKEVTDP